MGNNINGLSLLQAENPINGKACDRFLKMISRQTVGWAREPVVSLFDIT
jgi:hypothetical protein